MEKIALVNDLEERFPLRREIWLRLELKSISAM